MKIINENIKPDILYHLSVLIARTALDGELSRSDSVYLSRWYYEQKFKQPVNNSLQSALIVFFDVPRTRFELVHPYECHPLKMVRLPISPPGLFLKVDSLKSKAK
jgi:hypothetical protein